MSGTQDSSVAVSGSSSDTSLEQSGPLSDHTPHSHPRNDVSVSEHTTGTGSEGAHRSDVEEQSLEWHEVIELQAFSDRKVWIEEKIKVCQKQART